MKIKFLLILALLFPLALVAQSYHSGYQDGKIWFRLKNDIRIKATIDDNPYKVPLNSIPGFESLTAGFGVTNLSRPFHAAKTSMELQRTYLVEFTDYNAVEDFIKKIEASNLVDYAEKVPLDKKCLTPNDPSYGSQWFLNTISAPSAWNYFSAGSNIKIAIVDDAVERTHSDIAPNLWVNPGDPIGGGDQDGNGYVDDINGYDVGGAGDNNPDPPTPSYDHGTHVAGCASARSNNGTGVASIGFSCKIIAVKATTTPTSITDGYNGIVYAVAAGADVINMSWGGSFFSTTGQTVCTYAWNSGCILVAAAGNDNVSTQFYPAAYTNVISVAATGSGDTKASFSNYGNWIDISAPGVSIYSTTVGNTYGYKQGTSMASPIVAGLIGLMWSLNPNMPKQDIVNCLLSTADNISAQNPGYPGQLGSGRIDANAAMTCVSATLNNPPVAAFTANTTTVTAGGNVIFADQSTYSPTSWTWSFPGGTPSSYVGQVPPTITYNTPGSYNVTLTVSNANGTNTLTMPNYIVVSAASGCLKMNFPIPGGWGLVNYGLGTPIGADGWVSGPNMYLDKQKAMYFDASATPYTILNNVWIAFGLGYSATPSKIVPVRIYDGTAGPVGPPGALLGTTNLTMAQIMADVNGNFYTEVSFVNNPITLPASKKFFVSVDITNLCWTGGCHDTLSIVSNTDPQTIPSAAWEQQSTNTWYRYDNAAAWGIDISLVIHPWLTNQNTQAVITTTPGTTICEGNTISFDAVGSTYQDTLLWVFNGGNPTVVPSDPTQDVLYNTPGSYNAILYVIGGGCNLFDSTFTTITVNANPVVSVSATPSATYCNGGSATLTASGASTYLWGPASGLSGTTGPVVTANPTTSTSYQVQGTAANGCVSDAFIDITVLNPPTSVVAIFDTTEGCLTNMIFDGINSIDAITYAWSFSGGTPTGLTTATPSVDFSTGGPYNAQLITTNACGSDTASLSFNVNVTPNNLNVLFTASDTTIDCGASIDFDATSSVDASGYAWTFTGGSPSSSTSATATITYNTPGTFPVVLIGSNACDDDTTGYTVTVLNNCGAGIEDVEAGITGYYSYPMQGYIIESLYGFSDQASGQLYNEIGQVIFAKPAGGGNQLIVPTHELRAGMYIIKVSDKEVNKSFKFIIK